MDIAEKSKIADKIIKSNDEELLQEIKMLVGLSNEDFWNDLPDEIKDEIEAAKKELDEGKGISHEQVMAEINSQFRK